MAPSRASACVTTRAPPPARAPPHRPAAPLGPGRRWSLWPWSTPLVFLVVQAFQTGWSTLQPLLFRSLTAQLLWNTVSLTVVVTALCAVLGTLLAWFVERTDAAGAAASGPSWSSIPLGIPDFVVSFGWRAIFPGFGGFWAAVLVMTLAVYPLVFLPVAANMRNADPAQEEVARSLGLGRLRTFWKVTVGQARLAILGGAVLVALVCLAEFGAFEILGFRTLTTEAYTEFTVGFNTAAGLCLLADPGRPRRDPPPGRGRGAGQGPRRPHRVGRRARHAAPAASAAAPCRCWPAWRRWSCWRWASRRARSST